MKAMLTEDSLMRMINLAVAVIARALGLKTAGQYLAAQQVIDQFLEEMLGLRLDLIEQLDDDRLIAIFTFQDTLDKDRLWIAATLFNEQGNLHALQNRLQQSYWSHLRALNFYLLAILEGGAPNFPETDENIALLVQSLLDSLEGFALPSETRYSLYGYYEQSGQYARGEQVLAGLLDAPGYGDEMRQEYKDYHLRLLAKSDAELKKGGLDRAQVQSNLAGA